MADIEQPPPEPLPELPGDKHDLANAAERLLADPVFQLAMSRVQTRLFESWKASAPGDVREREEAYELHWAVEELRSELRRMIASARL
jgi:hypothetical protein